MTISEVFTDIKIYTMSGNIYIKEYDYPQRVLKFQNSICYFKLVIPKELNVNNIYEMYGKKIVVSHQPRSTE